jgi:hypothetical protein
VFCPACCGIAVASGHARLASVPCVVPGGEGAERPFACASPAGREPHHAVGGQETKAFPGHVPGPPAARQAVARSEGTTTFTPIRQHVLSSPTTPSTS